MLSQGINGEGREGNEEPKYPHCGEEMPESDANPLSLDLKA
jgi:hypothetical protein